MPAPATIGLIWQILYPIILMTFGFVFVQAICRKCRGSWHGVMLELYEWTHKHFPNLMDCRPIYVRRALEAAGFKIKESDIKSMGVPVEIVLGMKE